MARGRALPLDRVESARALAEVAQVAIGVGLVSEGEEALANALQVYDVALGPTASETLECALALALHRRHMGRIGEASQVLSRFEEGTIPQSDLSVRGMGLRATLLGEQGDPSRALTLLTRARELAAEHPDVSQTARWEVEYTLGTLYEARGALTDAHEAFDAARALAAQMQPATPEKVVLALRASALLFAREGNLSMAERTLERCLRTLPGQSPLMPELLADQAGFQLRAGRSAEARRSGEAALALAEELWEPEDPRLPQLLAGVAAMALASDEGPDESTKELLYRALAMNTELWGDDHPEVASTLLLLGQAHLRLQQVEPAVALLRRARRLREHHGASPVEIANVEGALGTALLTGGDVQEARAVFEKALTRLPTGDEGAEALRETIRRQLERSGSAV